MRCPICDTPFVPDESPAMPFCSRRCQQIDLGRWLDEEYRMPIEPADDLPDDDSQED